jgi:hypothetical protein
MYIVHVPSVRWSKRRCGFLYVVLCTGTTSSVNISKITLIPISFLVFLTFLYSVSWVDSIAGSVYDYAHIRMYKLNSDYNLSPPNCCTFICTQIHIVWVEGEGRNICRELPLKPLAAYIFGLFSILYIFYGIIGMQVVLLGTSACKWTRHLDCTNLENAWLAS